MNNESLVHNLYKFIREGVSVEKMCESKIKSYKLDEGKLPKDPSKIEDPNGDVQLLAEKEKKVTQKSAEKEADAAINKDIETAGAGKTEEPELTDLQKEAAKETPVDKLTQNKDGEDPLNGEPKVKGEKKITPEVTGVEKVKEDKTEEGKLPKDPSLVKTPEEDIQLLSEEKVLTTVSDEKVAKDISLKYPGSRIVNDKTPDGKNQFIVMVKEQKVNEISSFKEVIDSTISKLTAERIGQLAGVKLELSNPIESDVSWVWKINTPEYDEVRLFKKDGVIFLSKGDKTQKQIPANESKVKEDIEVTVKADGEEINVTSTSDGIQATKVNPAAQPIDRVETGVEVVEEEPDFYEGEEEWSDEEAGEMEEKIALSAHLGTLEKLTEKQKKFKDEVDGKKIGKKNKSKLKNKKK